MDHLFNLQRLTHQPTHQVCEWFNDYLASQRPEVKNTVFLHPDVPLNVLDNAVPHVGVFLEAQNLALVFTRKGDEQIALSAFAVAPCSEDVTNHVHLYGSYPTASGTYPRSAFTPSWFATLRQLAKNRLPNATDKRKKDAELLDELREVQDPLPSLEYLLAMLPQVQLEEATFTKTIHDRVLWKNEHLPRRRSPAWLAFKVMLKFVHVCDPTFDHKALLTDFMIHQLEQVQLNPHDMKQAVAKIARRCKKLGRSSLPAICECVHQPTNLPALVPSTPLDQASDKHEGIKAVVDEYRRVAPAPSTVNHKDQADPDVAPLYQYTRSIFRAVVSKTQVSLDQPMWLQQSIDPLVKSRIVLASLGQLMYLHQQAGKETQLLLEHSVDVDLTLLHQLLCPSKLERQALHAVETYFATFQHQPFPDLLQKAQTEQTFGYRFVQENEDDYRVLEQRIRRKDQQLRTQKLDEVRIWKQKMKRLEENTAKTYCERCRNFETLNKEKHLRAHEILLPENRVKKDSVLFELQVPPAIAAYRDALYLVQANLLHGEQEVLTEENWQDQLAEFRSAQTRVTLESAKKSFRRDHGTQHTYTNMVLYTESDASFIKKNPLDCHLQAGKKVLNKATTLDIVYKTPKLQQYMKPNYTQNQVLCNQQHCPEDMSLNEYLDLASLNPFPYLKPKEILRVLVAKHVKLKEQYSVAMIKQALHRVDQPGTNWYRIHEDYLHPEDYAHVLDQLVEEYEGTRNNRNAFQVIYAVLHVLSEHGFDPTRLARKCVSVFKSWCDDATPKVGEVCALALQTLALFDHQLADWLYFANRLSVTTRITPPRAAEAMVDVQHKLNALDPSAAQTTLSEFAGQHLKHKVPHAWKKQSPTSCWWYINTETTCVQVHLLTGTLRVNGLEVQKLPDAITHSEEYQALFGTSVLNVQPKTHGVYLGKVDGRDYEFQLVDTHVRIYQHDKLYVPRSVLAPHLPAALQLAKHWLHLDTAGTPTKLVMNDAYWDATSTCIFNARGHRLLAINPEHVREFASLDALQHLHAWRDQGTHVVELVRYGLKFTHTPHGYRSHEYPGRTLVKNANLGTLVGLHTKLVLDHPTKHRLVLIPRSKVRTNLQRETIIQLPEFESVKKWLGGSRFDALMRKKIMHVNYKVYTVDPELHELRTTASVSDQLYLALLHAHTSQEVPDPFQHAVGYQLAMDLLRRCRPSEPFSRPQMKILKKIQDLSPLREYYPKHLKTMETIAWSHPSQYDGYAVLVDQLVSEHQTLQKFAGQEVTTKFRDQDQLFLNRRALLQVRDAFPLALPLDLTLPQKVLNQVVQVRFCHESLFDCTPGFQTRKVKMSTLLSPHKLFLHSKLCETTNPAIWEQEVLKLGKDHSILTYWLVLYQLALKESPADMNMLLGYFLSRTTNKNEEDALLLLAHVCRKKETYAQTCAFPELPDRTTYHKIHESSWFAKSYIVVVVCKNSRGKYRPSDGTPYKINHQRISELWSIWDRDKNIHINTRSKIGYVNVDNNNGRSCHETIQHLRDTSENRAIATFLKQVDKHVASWTPPLATAELATKPRTLPKTTLRDRWTKPAPSASPDWTSLRNLYLDAYGPLNDWGLARPCTRLGLLRDELATHHPTHMHDTVFQWAQALRPGSVVAAHRPEWLALELVLGLHIRPEQVDIAEHMLRAKSNLNTQLHMGQGKSSVILPMLALTMSNGTVLARVTLLRSLFRTHKTELQWKLNLLGRRVACVPFVRTVDVDPNKVLSFYQTLAADRGVLVTKPEHLMSFALKVCQTPAFAALDDWDRARIRDVLDETDEILHYRNQLVYPLGEPRLVDGGALRWQVCEALLRTFAARVVEHPHVVYTKPARPGEFPVECRLVGRTPFDALKRTVARAVLDDLDVPGLVRLTEPERAAFVDEIFEPRTHAWSEPLTNLLLILRAHLQHEVLRAGLRKRHRVQYGLAPQRRTTMAVPYRAKDQPSDRAEFSHPDMALLQTCLSWFYTGLTADQFRTVIKQVSCQPHPAGTYHTWTKDHPSLPRWASVDLENLAPLHAALHKSMDVISYWMQQFVFPVYAKQFERKSTASPSDLARARTHATVGFSGTNGLQELLPLTMKQHDLPQTLDTNNRLDDVLANQGSCACVDTTVLDHLVSTQVPVLLDVGALVKDTNVTFARKWLHAQTAKSHVVFFDKQHRVLVMDADNNLQELAASSMHGRLSDCLVYLDDAHTRGTHLDFPNPTHAVVTLGEHVSRDRLAQGCMRLRRLGTHHTVAFLASKPVFRRLENTDASAVLQWAKRNTVNEIRHGVLPWAEQHAVSRAEASARDAKTPFQQREPFALEDLYGTLATRTPIQDQVRTRYRVHADVVDHGCRLAQAAQSHALALDEEQERELERELEDERQVERPPTAQPRVPVLDPRLLDRGHQPAFPGRTRHTVYVSLEFHHVVQNNPGLPLYQRPPTWFVVDTETGHRVALTPWEANELHPRFRTADIESRDWSMAEFLLRPARLAHDPLYYTTPPTFGTDGDHAYEQPSDASESEDDSVSLCSEGESESEDSD